MKSIFTMRRSIAVGGIAAAAFVAGCAATPSPATGATAPAAGATALASAPWCVQGKYGGADAMANCNRGFTENSR